MSPKAERLIAITREIVFHETRVACLKAEFFRLAEAVHRTAPERDAMRARAFGGQATPMMTRIDMWLRDNPGQHSAREVSRSLGTNSESSTLAALCKLVAAGLVWRPTRGRYQAKIIGGPDGGDDRRGGVSDCAPGAGEGSQEGGEGARQVAGELSVPEVALLGGEAPGQSDDAEGSGAKASNG